MHCDFLCRKIQRRIDTIVVFVACRYVVSQGGDPLSVLADKLHQCHVHPNSFVACRCVVEGFGVCVGEVTLLWKATSLTQNNLGGVLHQRSVLLRSKCLKQCHSAGKHNQVKRPYVVLCVVNAMAVCIPRCFFCIVRRKWLEYKTCWRYFGNTTYHDPDTQPIIELTCGVQSNTRSVIRSDRVSVITVA